jgi:DUF1680 family protein
VGRTHEHQLRLSEDERRLLQAILYTELDAAEENVRDFEVDGPPEALDDARNYATLVRQLYERIRGRRPSRCSHDQGLALQGHYRRVRNADWLTIARQLAPRWWGASGPNAQAHGPRRTRARCADMARPPTLIW